MKELADEQRVVITGMGAVLPGAGNVPGLLEMLREGRSGIEYQPELEALNFACRVGGKAVFDPDQVGDYFHYYNLDQTSSFIQLACVAGVEAWLSSGLSLLPPEDTGVDWDTGIMIGTGIGGIDAIGGKVVPLTDAGKVKRIGSVATQNTMPSGPAAHLSMLVGAGNQCTANSSACCTGTEAILDSYYRIRMGLATRMLAGGSEGYSPYFWAGFDSLRAMNSKSNEHPEAASRPMSESARGFVPGSGAGVLLLESLKSARERKAPIYGEVLGGSLNCGAQRNGGSMTFPNPEGVIRCIRESMKQAGVSAKEIQLISGHLTGTKADPLEIRNWVAALGEEIPFPKINAPKSLFGHCLGAAGAVEAVATLLQIQYGFVHASLNCEDVHPEIAALIPAESIPHQMLPKPDLKVAINASFGFGDVNSCVIFKKWE